MPEATTLEAPADTTTATTTTPPAGTTPTTPGATTTPTTTDTALAKPVPLHERIPEKFHVKRAGEKGEEFDPEASMGKVLEGYKALEQRVGSGDLPPKAAEEYTFTVPDTLKEQVQMDDAKLAEFKKEALAAGMTQKQFEFSMGRYVNALPQLVGEIIQNQAGKVIESLDKAWGADYDKNLAAAQKTFDTFATPEEKGKFDAIMTNPAMAYQMLARIAGELGEARGIPADAGGGNEASIQQLLTSPILQDAKHPEYAATRAKVDAHYAKKYGTAVIT